MLSSRWLLLSLPLLAVAGPALGKPPVWTNVSSSRGELPVPGGSKQQTAALIADLDRDGVSDFVLAFRQKAPALLWYRRQAKGWDRRVLDADFLAVEAGGAAADIDGDGDLDLVFGGDASSNQLWWWENPHPRHDPAAGWKRRTIKKDGANQHHDQAFGDFLGKGRPQLVYWNQRAKALLLAEIPADPRGADAWPATTIFSGAAGEGVKQAATYAEGVAAADVDGDGKLDVLAGNYWLKHQGGTTFKPIRIAEIGGRIAAGKLIAQSRLPQVVIAPGDGSGPLRWYEVIGDPQEGRSWIGHDLVGGDIVHGHTLDLGDVDGDGHVDVLAAEMAKWTDSAIKADHPQAKAWIFYGDGRGRFRPSELATGHGFHEGKLGDLDGDGDLDVLNKPYTWEAPRIDIWLQNGTGPRRRTAASAR